MLAVWHNTPCCIETITMSDTGYLYLSFAELNELVLVHLISGVDQDIDIGGDQ